MTENEQQAQPQSTESQTPAITDDMSFSDYVNVRRGLPVESKTNSAPVEKTEQKKTSNSESEETEELEAKESEGESDEDESNDSVEKPKKKGGFQRRIDKMTARNAEVNSLYEAERVKREALEQRLAQLEGAGKPKQVDEVKASDPSEPNPENFDSHSEYVKAVTKWMLKEEAKAQSQEQEKQKLISEQEKVFKSHSERVKAFSSKVDDFQDVLEAVDHIPVSVAVQNIILSSENGAELMYELAKNKEEYERINQLSPLSAAREIGKFESKIASKSSEPKQETKKLTNAPKPIEPVGNSKVTVGKSIEDPDIPFSEYERLRRKQMKRR